ncbi:hypothetical protein ACFFLM_04475 [Deinococcus oregonensis]|uniref:Lipoprotein n=1 Tax=Deinococcus oregonensis TaxID=1805970 RepID=A0ABV6AYJ4_9DEIO
MKKLLILPFMAVLLASCGGDPTPPPSTVGVWDGTFTVNGRTSPPLIFTFKQSNTPNAGDFSGTAAVENDPEGSEFSGNALQGTLVSYDAGESLNCQGTFTNFAQYQGACVLTSGQDKLNASLVLKKR